MLTGAAPAEAILGTISGAVQRAQMIVNQATQIANQVRQVRTMTRQLDELEDQLDYMEEVARGEVGALADPFTELAAGPARARHGRPRLGSANSAARQASS